MLRRPSAPIVRFILSIVVSLFLCDLVSAQNRNREINALTNQRAQVLGQLQLVSAGIYANGDQQIRTVMNLNLKALGLLIAPPGTTSAALAALAAIVESLGNLDAAMANKDGSAAAGEA